MVVGAEQASFEAVRAAAEARAEVGGGQTGRGAGSGKSRAVLAGADEEGRAAPFSAAKRLAAMRTFRPF